MSELPLRRGLPREPGGQPWPPAGTVSAPAQMHDGDASPQRSAPSTGVAAEVSTRTTGANANGSLPSVPVLRRGLPREPGGEPWPVVAATNTGSTAGVDVSSSSVSVTENSVANVQVTAESTGSAGSVRSDADGSGTTAATAAGDGVPASAAAAAIATSGVGAMRRGLPREVGGEAWPTDSDIAASVEAVPGAGTLPGAGALSGTAAAAGNATADSGTDSPGAGSVDTSRPEASPTTRAAATTDEDETSTAAETTGTTDGLAANTAAQTGPTGTAGTAGRSGMSVPASKGAGATGAGDAVGHQKAKPVAKLYRGKTLAEWARFGALSVGGLIVVALIAVFGVRWWLGTEAMQDFLATYPGQYELPANAPEGFPAWLRWSHFFNVFLMVLIIRSGWQIRTEKKPQAYWTPKWNKKRKISLTMWFHQALDLLWVINGAVFVVLLFATGQWMRIVPTSWEVFPNALSAGLQYVSLDWPIEDGWVNYNSLQQLTYFATVFVAAPLAVVTGVRMSGLWPNKPALNKAYPIEAARAVHFPVMIYFVVFIITHVFLVLSTGALRNLNHMYTGTSEVSWVGFWLFVLSLGVIVGGVFAARALVIAPIASLFGRVGR
ncbi:cytochrome b/b6 domain-containing protein [Haematomicrobium sanguinis]|uniref:cytochrome b/b6 domain-containing protein n=1 Tax=Haematomicrobium sanguinis TaxID=479106 RepID=UPI00047A587A|nr:cytochrome b/b6 domain-containing protein [Haematomicrobium sanguinis]